MIPASADWEPETGVVIPYYPAPSGIAILPDVKRIESRAADYCATAGTATAAEFFLGVLPRRALDEFAVDISDAAPPLGDLYLSGYFGGIWLRDELGGDGASLFPAGETRPALLTPDALDASAAATVQQISGGDELALEAALNALSLVLFIYSYNKGYLEELLEHPPAGYETGGALTCPTFYGCTSSLAAPVGDYLDSATGLDEPRDERWDFLSQRAKQIASSAEVGRNVWDNVLGALHISSTTYPLLVTLSANFLMAAQGSALASAEGWANRSPDAARVGVRLGTAMTVWSGAYFMGLTSSAPIGTFPILKCP